MDWILYALLAIQIADGIAVALLYPWGSSWFAISLAPYLRSLFQFHPDISYVAGMPFLVKLHILNAFAIFGLLPFTRLVHILVVPIPYLWRKPQVVRWYRKVEEVCVRLKERPRRDCLRRRLDSSLDSPRSPSSAPPPAAFRK